METSSGPGGVPPAGDNPEHQGMLLGSDQILRLLEDNVRDCAVIVLDTVGRIVRWNKGAERILGYPAVEVIGQGSALLFTTDDRASGVPESELACAAAAGRAEAERWHRRKGGAHFWASGSMTGLRDSDGRLCGFAKLLRDATAEKRAEGELADAYRREHRTAEILQRSLLLGPTAHAFPGLEVSTQYEPASDDLLVGGDFHDVFRLAAGRVAFVVGDVVGKGLRAAAHTAQIKFALRAFLREYPHPAIALERLNSFLNEAERLDDPGGGDEARFVVLCLGIVDPASGELTLAGAGIEPPLILRVSGANEAVRTDGSPLGVFDAAGFSVARRHLGPGDLLLLTTDGLTESRRAGAAGGTELLGYDGLTVLARQSLPLGTLARVGEAIVAGARAFGGGRFRDDVCLLLARRS